MYQWISQYLTNRVHVDETYSRKKTPREGVHQGGILSLTLILVFINDVVRDMPRKVLGAIYADDLVLWCSDEHLTTANYRLQQALSISVGWTKWCLVKTNPRKTAYAIFSLLTKEKKASLHINGQTLLAEDNPTYLRFDSRLTSKQQTEKAEARARVRLAPMKKLAGTTCSADTVTLKRLYTGRVRPVLEYGMTARGTIAKSNYDRVSKVQNQATRIITRVMKSTPIVELETITGLQSLDDCRGYKLLNQAAKFKRLQDHSMRQRLPQPTKGTLKRRSFIHNSGILERQKQGILDHDPKESPPCLAVPAWGEGTSSIIWYTIPGVGQKDSQSEGLSNHTGSHPHLTHWQGASLYFTLTFLYYFDGHTPRRNKLKNTQRWKCLLRCILGDGDLEAPQKFEAFLTGSEQLSIVPFIDQHINHFVINQCSTKKSGFRIIISA